jgi:hypothetical protein
MTATKAAIDGEHRVCSACIYDSRVPGITFDGSGRCNYCAQVSFLRETYGTGEPKGRDLLDAILAEIRSEGRGKRYDCVIGVSGGTDSSYLLCKAVEWGLRPLAVHYDNTWNSAIATQNIRKVTEATRTDLHTHVVDNREVDDIKRAFLLAGVPEFDADTDIAFVQTLRKAAASVGVRYILEGHSFMTEGVSPVGGNYLDGAYVADVHDRFGRLSRRTFPNMTFASFLRWATIHNQRFIRPLWYLDYDKERARDYLKSAANWLYYGGHHLENRASTFAHTVWLPQRFGVDYRNLTLAASARRGAMSREEAVEIYRRPVSVDPRLVEYVKKRVGFEDSQYQECMGGPKRSFRDFKTYKRRFELLRPLFYVLAKTNRVPMSFYLKYCFPLENRQ